MSFLMGRQGAAMALAIGGAVAPMRHGRGFWEGRGRGPARLR